MPTLGSLTFSKRVAWQSASTPAPLHPCLLFLYVYYLYITASFGPQRPCRKYGNFFRVNFTERNSFKVLIPTADTDASSTDTLSPHLNCHCWIMIRSIADEQVAPILRLVCGSYLSSHLPPLRYHLRFLSRLRLWGLLGNIRKIALCGMILIVLHASG